MKVERRERPWGLPVHKLSRNVPMWDVKAILGNINVRAQELREGRGGPVPGDRPTEDRTGLLGEGEAPGRERSFPIVPVRSSVKRKSKQLKKDVALVQLTWTLKIPVKLTFPGVPKINVTGFMYVCIYVYDQYTQSSHLISRFE